MNNSTTKTFYLYLITTVGLMLILETGLEYRHYRLGYDTPIFGTQPQAAPAVPSASDADAHASRFGPAPNFPFRSERIAAEKGEHFRIWIASASHAYGGRVPAERIFPNLICQPLPPSLHCQSINGSDNGMTVSGNIRLLQQYAPTYLPDMAILYQMSMIISAQQKKLTQGEAPSESSSNAIMDFSPAIKLFESLSLYVHLSDYIGNNIKLQGNLKERFPPEMDADFTRNITDFIQACQDLNIRPVLTTFALSHDLSNIDEMSRTEITNFVKYQAYLSPTGWIKTVEHYNQLMKQIAQEHDLPLVELDRALHGKPQYFIDYVHFNEAGHRIVAQTISDTLNNVLAKERSHDL